MLKHNIPIIGMSAEPKAFESVNVNAIMGKPFLLDNFKNIINGFDNVKQILIVDDNEGVRFSLRMFLRVINNEVKVFEASNPTEVKDITPDLIITDNDMPELQGTEWVKQIRDGKYE
jgi:PleD family two-component response regulator